MVIVTLRNLGSGFATTTQLSLAVVGPGSAVNMVDTKSVGVGGFTMNQQQTIEVKGVDVPQAGTWRFIVVADAGKAVAESNETNNTGSLRVADVQQPCSF